MAAVTDAYPQIQKRWRKKFDLNEDIIDNRYIEQILTLLGTTRNSLCGLPCTPLSLQFFFCRAEVLFECSLNLEFFIQTTNCRLNGAICRNHVADCTQLELKISFDKVIICMSLGLNFPRHGTVCVVLYLRYLLRLYTIRI